MIATHKEGSLKLIHLSVWLYETVNKGEGVGNNSITALTNGCWICDMRYYVKVLLKRVN